jgi:hypothetical protein
VGTPVPFQRCLAFIIATANEEFTLTAGKFVPVSKKTMMNVSIRKSSAIADRVHIAAYPVTGNDEGHCIAPISIAINYSLFTIAQTS